MVQIEEGVRQVVFFRFFSADMKRALRDYKLYTIIVIIAVVFSVAESYGERFFSEWIKFISLNARLVMVAVAASAAVYSYGLGEDMEYGYYKLLLLRGNPIAYIVSKTICTFLTGALAMAGGFGLACVYKFLTMMHIVEDVDYDAGGLYVKLFFERRFIAYFLAVMLHYAVFAGIVALIGMLISLYIENRLITYTAPIALIMILNIFLQRFLGVDIGASLSIYALGAYSITSPVGFMSIPVYFTEMLIWFVTLIAWIYMKFRKKVCYGK